MQIDLGSVSPPWLPLRSMGHSFETMGTKATGGGMDEGEHLIYVPNIPDVGIIPQHMGHTFGLH